MKIKKFLAVVWMLATILPLFMFPLSILMLTLDLLGGPSNSFGTGGDEFLIYAFVMNGLVISLTTSYLIYLFVTPYVPRQKRMLWLVVLLFTNIISMPFFWYWYVWGPLKGSLPSDIESVPRKSKIVPIMIGGAMLAVIPGVVIVVEYFEGQSYSNIADKYPLSEGTGYTAISADRVSITKQNRASQAVSTRDIFDVSVDDESVRFETSSLRGILYRPFEIPANAVHSCSKQCGIGARYILLLKAEAIEISVGNAEAILDWCWQNNLPILARSQRMEWLYNGEALPEQSDLDQTLKNRSTYDYAARQACHGF